MGGAIPDLSDPDSSQDGDWTYTGGVGTLAVLNDASVTVGDALTLQGVVTIADDGTETAEGGIDVESWWQHRSWRGRRCCACKYPGDCRRRFSGRTWSDQLGRDRRGYGLEGLNHHSDLLAEH